MQEQRRHKVLIGLWDQLAQAWGSGHLETDQAVPKARWQDPAGDD